VPGRRLPDQRWSDIRVSQAGRSDRTLRVAPQQNGKELALGGFDCRVDTPIVIEMAERAQAAAQQNWQTWEFRSPCPALRTVAADKNAAAAPKRAVVAQALPRAAKSEAGEQVWDVEVLVADNNQVAYSLWLTVSFDKDLPPLNEWSQPLGQ